jgi:hypothetical protein
MNPTVARLFQEIGLLPFNKGIKNIFCLGEKVFNSATCKQYRLIYLILKVKPQSVVRVSEKYMIQGWVNHELALRGHEILRRCLFYQHEEPTTESPEGSSRQIII